MKIPGICKDCMYSQNQWCKQAEQPISLMVKEKACNWVEESKKRQLED